MTKIVVVEDDMPLLDTISRYLSLAGMDVRAVDSAEGMFRSLQEDPADIVVLDVNLPGENGFVAAARLRETSEVGLILMTARNVEGDRLAGLSSGADAYLSKPLQLQELEAAIRNLRRRLKRNGDSSSAERGSSGSSWHFEKSGWALSAPNGIRVELTATEHAIISAIVAAGAGHAVGRATIAAAFGKKDRPAEDRSIDMALSRLRKKVADATGLALPVKAARSKGYTFTAPVTQTP
jgi:DNA-binding response OmpR family regulator